MECMFCEGHNDMSRSQEEELRIMVRAHIKDYGLSIIGVHNDNGPHFTYSIGLRESLGYELIVSGLSPRYAHTIFTAIYKSFIDGNTLDFNVPDDRLSNLPVSFEICKPALAREYATQAFVYYERDVQVVQMVLSDRSGILPHQEGYDHEYMGKRQHLFYDGAFI